MGLYAFNPHSNRTSDGTLIVPGLRVRTNDWTVGVVVADTNAHGCCGEATHHGQKLGGDGRTMFTDHAANDTLDCQAGCRHNHWFNVKFDDESVKQYDGERMGTVDTSEAEGKFARFMWEVDTELTRRVGFPSDALEDYRYRDEFDAGTTAYATVAHALAYMEEGGF